MSEGSHIVGDGDVIVTVNNYILPEGLNLITSNPGSGKCKVINIVYDPETGDTDVEYDETPEE